MKNDYFDSAGYNRISHQVNSINADSLVEVISNPLCILDNRGTILKMNKSWENLVGKENEFKKYTGEHFTTVCSKLNVQFCEEGTDLNSKIKNLIEGKVEEDSFEFQINTGKITKTLSAKIKLFGDETNSYVLISSEDITQERNNELAAKEGKEKLDLVLEASESGFWDWDLVTGVFDYDQKGISILGYKPVELQKTFQQWVELIHPDEKNKITDAVLKHIEKKDELFEIEHRLKTKDADWLWILARGKVVKRNDEGIPLRVVGTFMNVTNRKENENKLKVFSEIIEQSPVSVVITDDQGNIEYVNNKLLELSGYELNHVLGKNPRIFQSKYTPVKIYEEMWKTIKSGKTWKGEFRNRKKSGELYWEAATIFPIKTGNNFITHFVGLKEDITEKKKFEDALKKSKKRYEGLVESQNDLIVRVDNTGRFTFANSAYCKKFGVRQDELIGKKFMPLVHPDDLEDTINKMEELKYPPYRITIEQRALTKDGWRRISWEDYAIRDENGITTEIQAVGRDITRQKETEEALIEAHNYLDKIINSVADPIFVKDDEFKYYLVNDALCKYIGYEKQQIIGKTDYDLFRKEQADYFREKDTYVVDSGKDITYEEYITDSQNQKQIALAKKALVKYKSGKNFIAGTLNDITHKKLEEEKLIEAYEKEKELSGMRNQFIATVSHEYRTPLTSIYSSAELLELYSHKLDENKKLGHLYKIKKSVQYMIDLLDDVMLISRADRGELKKNFETFELIQSINDTVSELQNNTGEKCSIKLSTDVDELVIDFDRKIFNLIFGNLLNNAIKYSVENGNVYLKLKAEEKKFILSVKDEGIGIPENEIDKLFNPFFRTSNCENIPGTGLGLSIVKKCIDLFDGKIDVKSELNKGTEFIISLPFK